MKVGFIGLGRMGQGMARRILGAGHELSVFDMVAAAMAPFGEAGARVASSVADLCSGREVVATMLVEDKAMRRYFPTARKVGLICREHCIESGLVMRAVRDVMIVAPPLVITEAEIDEMARKARLALDLTWRDLQAG